MCSVYVFSRTDNTQRPISELIIIIIMIIVSVGFFCPGKQDSQDEMMLLRWNVRCVYSRRQTRRLYKPTSEHLSIRSDHQHGFEHEDSTRVIIILERPAIFF